MFPAACSHAETPNKMTNKAAKRLMMPSHLIYFLKFITIEAVEETKCEPIVYAMAKLPARTFNCGGAGFFRVPT